MWQKISKIITKGLCCLTVLICNATKDVTSQVSNIIDFGELEKLQGAQDNETKKAVSMNKYES